MNTKIEIEDVERLRLARERAQSDYERICAEFVTKYDAPQELRRVQWYAAQVAAAQQQYAAGLAMLGRKTAEGAQHRCFAYSHGRLR